jgi:hypothetical protein
MQMSANEFSLSKLSAALRAVNDAGEALAKSALDAKPNADGKVSGVDLEPLKAGLISVWDCIAPRGEADDSDPVLDPQERKLKSGSPTQERATGNDSRYDTRFSVAEIFNGKHSDDTSVGAPSLSEIFGGSKLAEG